MVFRIGCDLDGVIFEQMDLFLPYYQRFNCEIKSKENITDYDPEKLGFPLEEFQKMLISLEGNGDYQGMEPIPGAIESVNKFYEKLEAEIYYITARGSCLDLSGKESVMNDSRFSLNKYNAKFHELYHSSPKLNKIKELKIGVMIEDNPEEIKLLSENDICCICVNRPYNTEIKENKFIKKCNANEIFDCFINNYSKFFDVNLTSSIL